MKNGAKKNYHPFKTKTMFKIIKVEIYFVLMDNNKIFLWQDDISEQSN